jgi:ArsR family transcriptional regulator
VTKLTFRPVFKGLNYIQRYEYLNAGDPMIRRKTTYEIEAELFSALAHPARLEILELLREGEACVCHIQAMLDQRQAYISQHLNVLRQAGLVTNRKEGLRVYYQISDPCVLALVDSVKTALRSTGKRLAVADLPVLASARRKECNCPQCIATPVS